MSCRRLRATAGHAPHFPESLLLQGASGASALLEQPTSAGHDGAYSLRVLQARAHIHRIACNTQSTQRRQGECATADERFVDVIGSDGATTCALVAMRDGTSGLSSFAHLDGHNTTVLIEAMVSQLGSAGTGSLPPLELHLVGAYEDEEGVGSALIQSIVHVLASLDQSLKLKTACFGARNTTWSKSGAAIPIIGGFCTELRTGAIFRAAYSHRSHCEIVRSLPGRDASHSWYNTEEDEIAIAPFSHGMNTRTCIAVSQRMNDQCAPVMTKPCPTAVHEIRTHAPTSPRPHAMLVRARSRHQAIVCAETSCIRCRRLLSPRVQTSALRYSHADRADRTPHSAARLGQTHTVRIATACS
jgi:hypothetical protein